MSSRYVSEDNNGALLLEDGLGFLLLEQQDVVVASDDFSDDQTATWASADIGGAWTTDGTAANWNKAGGVGTLSTSAGGAHYGILASVNAGPDLDVNVRVQTAQTNLAAKVTLLARLSDTSNWYGGSVYFETNATLTSLISKRVAGTETDNDIHAAQGTYAANEFWWLHFQVSGTTIRMRLWKDGTSEPGTWNSTLTDSAFTAAGQVGLRCYNGSASTVVTKWDDFNATAPAPASLPSELHPVLQAVNRSTL